MTRLRVLLLVVAFAVLAACRPGVTPGSPESIYTHDDTRQAVLNEFSVFGAHVVACANAVLDKESAGWPYAGWGRTYKGAWQMHDGFEGSYWRAATELGPYWGTPYDPHVQTRAARYAWEAAGGTFTANWPTAPGGC